MRTTLITISLCFIMVFHIQAQSADKTSKIRQLLAMMKADSMALKQMDASMEAYKKMAAMVLEQNKIQLDSSLLTQQDKFLQKIIAKTKENTLKLINEDMVEVYDQYFTLNDIEALAAFYKTPVGQKMMGLTPVISKEIATRSMTKYQPEIAKLIKEYMDGIKRDAEK